MSSVNLALRDSATMLRRNLLHQVRYLGLTIMLIATPIVLLLVFVFVFGQTMGAGVAGAAGGRTEYLYFVTPGIVAMTIASAVQGTAISVATDMTEGIIDRFRTMNIARGAVLTGHVLGSLIQTMLGTVVAISFAMLLGYRTDATIIEWVAALAMIALFAFGVIWLAVAMGLQARSVETASNSPMIFMLLPFLGSGFVPTESLPAALRWFAEYQPFSATINVLRGLLTGDAIGSNGVLAVAWSVGLAFLGYLWARSQFTRTRS